MGLWIQIASGSNEPIYSQIVSQFSEAIARGELSPGDKLPAVRKLAEELVINPNTVARAYTLLEQQGLVSSKMGSGTYVTDPKLRDKDAARLSALTDRIDNLIAQALNMGLNLDEIRHMFENRLKDFKTHD